MKLLEKWFGRTVKIQMTGLWGIRCFGGSIVPVGLALCFTHGAEKAREAVAE